MVMNQSTSGDTVFSAELTGPTPIGTFNLPSSSDYGDPTIAQVITWHIANCPLCLADLDKMPEPFGVKSRRYCPEYWDIYEEYREYERDYALKGNP